MQVKIYDVRSAYFDKYTKPFTITPNHCQITDAHGWLVANAWLVEGEERPSQEEIDAVMQNLLDLCNVKFGGA